MTTQNRDPKDAIRFFGAYDTIAHARWHQAATREYYISEETRKYYISEATRKYYLSENSK